VSFITFSTFSTSLTVSAAVGGGSFLWAFNYNWLFIFGFHGGGAVCGPLGSGAASFSFDNFYF